LYDFLGVDSRSVGIALVVGLCDLGGGGLVWLKAFMIGGGGPCPFELYPGISLTTEEKNENRQSSQVVGDDPLQRLGCFLGAASAGLLNISSLQ
jgi:hypothetical protein